MTRKDYQVLVAAFAHSRPPRVGYDWPSWPVHIQWRFDVETVSAELAADNPRFDADKFMKACEG